MHARRGEVLAAVRLYRTIRYGPVVGMMRYMQGSSCESAPDHVLEKIYLRGTNGREGGGAKKSRFACIKEFDRVGWYCSVGIVESLQVARLSRRLLSLYQRSNAERRRVHRRAIINVHYRHL